MDEQHGTGASGPLAGVRVADFSRVLAGPYATMMLADFGADVVKIEPPAGDDTRHWTPPVDANGQATYFGSVNRNKRSVALDLTDAAGLAEARRLAASADVVIENFRPGVMGRFGLDHAAVRALNPGIVYCSITGFGSGAGSALAGYDLLVQAVGGLMSITGDADGTPAKAGVALVDVLTGQNALAGILLALRERDRTGTGQLVEIDLLGSLLSALTNQAGSTLATGVPPRRLGNAHPSIAPYSVFRAQDRELVIAVGNDKQFRALAEVLGDPSDAAGRGGRASEPLEGSDAGHETAPGGLLDRRGPGGLLDRRFATNAERVAHRAELTEAIERRLAEASAAHWIAALGEAGVPAGLVNDIAEAVAFAESLGLEPVVETRRTPDEPATRSIANPIRLAATPAAYRTPPPALDEHAGADWHPLDPTEGPHA
ncbi:crotonobetainyl-CoA:carnitine CoA-transferase CaiB-like acyl-CoA transferase [Agromyces terreus]|uniref:Crotonobetainyl-CoA:carnitine CoA-transferase CaiB-like acyl-CoA transferase n=1 Tax=Agromyces terreus TaxID=424795 RepID=A0A9X2KB79_9MICO|nr:CoA transferase [Agromyces terreus]MCP2369880.1 crotonobetainyl-CoA:carnitine CoA-transferase CaiB-like acyl-CoA transferase [Agromyces terreus]